MGLIRVSLQKIAEQDGGKYEAAVYAAQCNSLKRILSVCSDWEVSLFDSKLGLQWRYLD
ncbi:hypothetical protein SLEP1_g54549 [Rubroshorea leprosula]|nr:hypothetical protein SLEP1_g54549 [Rubroshorea leprosula]